MAGPCWDATLPLDSFTRCSIPILPLKLTYVNIKIVKINHDLSFVLRIQRCEVTYPSASFLSNTNTDDVIDTSRQISNLQSSNPTQSFDEGTGVRYIDKFHLISDIKLRVVMT